MKKLVDWFNRKFKRGPYVWDGVFLNQEDNVPEGFDPKAPQNSPPETEVIKVRQLFSE